MYQGNFDWFLHNFEITAQLVEILLKNDYVIPPSLFNEIKQKGVQDWSWLAEFTYNINMKFLNIINNLSLQLLEVVSMKTSMSFVPEWSRTGSLSNEFIPMSNWVTPRSFNPSDEWPGVTYPWVSFIPCVFYTRFRFWMR